MAASLIALADSTAFADLDVDAPNLHLIHGRRVSPKTEDWYGYEKAVLNPEVCSGCGACEQACRFGAIRNLVVDPYACEGCGVCEAVCPVLDAQGNKAIRLRETVTGMTMMYREPLPPEKATDDSTGTGVRNRRAADGQRCFRQAGQCRPQEPVRCVGPGDDIRKVRGSEKQVGGTRRFAGALAVPSSLRSPAWMLY